MYRGDEVRCRRFTNERRCDRIDAPFNTQLACVRVGRKQHFELIELVGPGYTASVQSTEAIECSRPSHGYVLCLAAQETSSH